MTSPTKISMMLGSVDHSPSEQLGAPSDWHTTVLILSQGNEHWQLAEEIACRLSPVRTTLLKWSARKSSRYKLEFERLLLERLDAHPVHIRAISAQGSVIEFSQEHIVSELGLAGLVQSFDKNNKLWLRFGPFTRITASPDGDPLNDTEPAFFEIAAVQGIPLIFICHFLMRMHREVMILIREHEPEIEWIDWQIMPNKFPGDILGPMGNLFHVIMSGAAAARLVAGNMRVATLTNSKDDHGSLLADNIAGLLAGKLAIGDYKLGQFTPHGSVSSVRWELWRQQP
jgi:hypothetical protein